MEAETRSPGRSRSGSGVVMAVVATGGVAVLASMFEHACWVGRQKAKVSCSHVARDGAHNVKVTGVFA